MLEGTLRVGYVRILELRKLNGKRRVPRLSVEASSASVCSAVVLPLLLKEDEHWVADSRVASAILMPVLSLGRRVVATAATSALKNTFSIADDDVAAGGPSLRTTCLSEALFEAEAMLAVDQDLMAMRVDELKEELEARGESKIGNKAWLRRRLHAGIVREYLVA